MSGLGFGLKKAELVLAASDAGPGESDRVLYAVLRQTDRLR